MVRKQSDFCLRYQKQGNLNQTASSFLLFSVLFWCFKHVHQFFFLFFLWIWFLVFFYLVLSLPLPKSIKWMFPVLWWILFSKYRSNMYNSVVDLQEFQISIRHPMSPLPSHPSSFPIPSPTPCPPLLFRFIVSVIAKKEKLIAQKITIWTTLGVLKLESLLHGLLTFHCYRNWWEYLLYFFSFGGSSSASFLAYLSLLHYCTMVHPNLKELEDKS